MKPLLILCVIAIISAKESKKNESKCEGIHIRDKFHRKQVLGMGLNRPYQLSYDQTEHRVYFSYNVGKDNEDSFEIGYLIKGHHEHRVLKTVENGFATAIDNKNGILYIGSNEGIFKKHLKTNGSEVERVITKHDVWDIFFKDHLYFITYPAQHLYKIITEKDKKIAEREKHIHEKIYQFAIDGDNDIYITNDTGLYRIKNGTKDRVWYEGPTVYRAIEINNKGIAHFSAQNAIYVPNKTNHSLEKIAHIKNLFGITFDSDDNIIYSDPHEIVKLLPENCK